MIGPISLRARLPEAVCVVERLIPEALAARESLSVTYSCHSCWRDPRKFKKCATLVLLRQIKGWNDTPLCFPSGISRDTSSMWPF